MKLRLIITALIGTMIPVMALYVARQMAPFPLASEDTDAAVAAALAAPIDEAISRHIPVLYIRSDLNYSLLPKLQALHPKIRLSPLSERPEDNGCKSDDPNIIISGPCLRGDFYIVSGIWFPLWNTALLGVGSSHGGSELILFKAFGKWRIVSERWWGV